MYNPSDSVDTAYEAIKVARGKGVKYAGYPVYDVTKSDLSELKKVGDKYGIPFEWLINLIRHETAGTFNPAITNSIGATGLIQFLRSTANGLGTTTDALRKMSFKQQLVYVDKYLGMTLKKHLTSEGKIPNTFTQGDVFMTIFYPASIGKADFQFSQKVTDANSGIKTPMDYVTRALRSSIFPISVFPYSLADVKKKFGEGYEFTKRNWLPIALIFVGIGGLVFYAIKTGKLKIK